MSPQPTKHYQVMSAPTTTTTSNITPSDPPAPHSSALPPSDSSSSSSNPSSSHPAVTPPRTPLLRLELRDLSSPGTHTFLRLVHASTALSTAVTTVLTHLYTALPPSSIPPTRSVTLVLREMDGVAYTTGLDLDSDHKEIHFNTSYIAGIDAGRVKEEMLGVLVHEMVHCWQWDGQGAAPGGLVEGIADWVRLKAGYAPPHWKRHMDCEWDAGYERTGYFLAWLEEAHGKDVVRRINEGLRGCKYDEERLWRECCGKGVKELWREYKKCYEEECK